MAFLRTGADSEWLAVRKESLCRIPEGIDDVSAASIPVAYLTAHMALMRAGFQAGKMVLAPAIGGSVGKKNVLGTNYHAEFYPPRCGEDRNRTAHRGPPHPLGGLVPDPPTRA